MNWISKFWFNQSLDIHRLRSKQMIDETYKFHRDKNKKQNPFVEFKFILTLL